MIPTESQERPSQSWTTYYDECKETGNYQRENGRPWQSSDSKQIRMDKRIRIASTLGTLRHNPTLLKEFLMPFWPERGPSQAAVRILNQMS